ncbi:MAG: 2-oxoacid:acceptor oxidoreductase family protein [Promethearchaeota archaeon]
MKSDSYTMVITGLGGQGLIKFLEILGYALIKENYNVISSETHGLSQRGGKVTCFLRYGTKLNAPIPLIGTANMIIALEESSVIDVLKFAKPDKSTLLIISTYEKPVAGIEYPSIQTLLNILYEYSDKIYFIPAMEIAEKETGNPKSMNSVILGYISKFLPLHLDVFEESISQNFNGKLLDLNLTAFRAGLEL